MVVAVRPREGRITPILLGIFAASAIGSALPRPVLAQQADAYPRQTIRFVIGFAAGGGNDIVTLADKLALPHGARLSAHQPMIDLITHWPSLRAQVAALAAGASASATDEPRTRIDARHVARAFCMDVPFMDRPNEAENLITALHVRLRREIGVAPLYLLPPHLSRPPRIYPQKACRLGA